MRAVVLIVIALLLAMFAVGVLCAGQERPAERVSPAPSCNPNALIWRTPQPPANPQKGDIWVNPKDSMKMVYIAPGQFIMGTSDEQVNRWLKEHPNDKREGFVDEQPQCQVSLSGYWIGRTEVTNAQYQRFVQAAGHRAPAHWAGPGMPVGLENLPVAGVDWNDARAYCEWARGRLPSELEWEKAARGSDGRTFPWGFRWDQNKCRNFGLITRQNYLTSDDLRSAFTAWLDSHDEVREGPSGVGSYPAGASPYGCLDMAGNLWEWCAEWYDATAYQRYAKDSLTPPKSGQYRILRGGSWRDAHDGHFRCAGRDGALPDDPDGGHCFYYGFRVARDAGK